MSNEKGNLTCPVYYNLTPEDFQAIVNLAAKAECSTPQYLRYITRKHIHEVKKKDCEDLRG